MSAMMILSFLLVLVAQAEKPALPPGMPAAPGVYCRQGDLPWTKMESATVSDMKTKGIDTFIRTDGYMNLSMTIIYAGSRAPLQIAAPRPAFYVRGAGVAKDAVIAQLSRAKDSRTLQTASSAGGVDNKLGVKKSELRNSTVTVYADDSFSILPDEDLTPGEYILLFGNANTGYDFGITTRKR
jgi:hypothetical protein